MLESSAVSKAVKEFLGCGSDVRIKIESDVMLYYVFCIFARFIYSVQILPLVNEALYSKIRMRAFEVRRQQIVCIVLKNMLNPALFAEFVLPFVHSASSDRTLTGRCCENPAC
jgi:hypothetical protein